MPQVVDLFQKESRKCQLAKLAHNHTAIGQPNAQNHCDNLGDGLTNPL